MPEINETPATGAPQNLPSAQPESKTPKQSDAEDKIATWQASLLPFMKWFLALSSAVFIGLTAYLFVDLEKKISYETSVDLRPYYDSLIQAPNVNKLDAVKWISVSSLEQKTVEQRYRQAGSLLKARIWVKYLGFLAGLIIAIVGSVFILGKIREKETGLDSKSRSLGSITFKSTSPGLFLVFFGTLLMVITMLKSDRIGVQDASTYMPVEHVVKVDKNNSGVSDLDAFDGMPQGDPEPKDSSGKEGNQPPY